MSVIGESNNYNLHYYDASKAIVKGLVKIGKITKNPIIVGNLFKERNRCHLTLLFVFELREDANPHLNYLLSSDNYIRLKTDLTNTYETELDLTTRGFTRYEKEVASLLRKLTRTKRNEIRIECQNILNEVNNLDIIEKTIFWRNFR